MAAYEDKIENSSTILVFIRCKEYPIKVSMMTTSIYMDTKDFMLFN